VKNEDAGTKCYMKFYCCELWNIPCKKVIKAFRDREYSCQANSSADVLLELGCFMPD